MSFMNHDFNGGGGEPQARHLVVYYKGINLKNLRDYCANKMTSAEYVSKQILKTEEYERFDPLASTIPEACAFARVFNNDVFNPQLIATYGYGIEISHELVLERARQTLGNIHINELEAMLPHHCVHYMTGSGDIFRREDDVSYIFKPHPFKKDIVWSQYDPVEQPLRKFKP